MNIAILGGAFDPPHIGHIYVATQVQERLNIDQVWLMPCGKHPFDKKLTDAATRLEMLRLIKNDFLVISDFEVQSRKYSYTIETLQTLTKRYPRYSFWWIIGSDQLAVFDKWKNWQELVAKYNLIIFPRDTEVAQLEKEVKSALKLSKIPDTITLLNTKGLFVSNLSSRLIRERVRSKKPITFLVSPKVENYILKNNLYGTK